MVENGRADAYVMDDILLAGLVASAKTPSDFAISTEQFSMPEPYGIMLRKDDPAFKKVVDAAMVAIYKSGEAARLYAKWFQSPIPPKGINLNFPETAPIKAAFANPNDKGVE